MPLPATLALRDLYAARPVHWRVSDAYLRVIAEEGSLEDIPILLQLFRDYQDVRGNIVHTIKWLGNETTVQTLLTSCLPLCTAERRKDENAISAVMEALGYLGYQPARELLWRHVFSGYYYISTAACLGLLHLDLSGMEDEIERAIRACSGKNLFPEFLPMLASRTGNTSMLPELYEWGEQAASSDCNGGLILGIALFGQPGLPYFKRLMWSQKWEVWGGGTGSDRWLDQGRRFLGLRLVDLYHEFQERRKQDLPLEQRYHDVMVLRACLDHTSEREQGSIRFIPPDTESYLSIYEAYFCGAGSEEGQTFREAAEEVGKPFNYYPDARAGLTGLELLLYQKAVEELRQAQR
jgi:hypothetical protein